MNGNHTLDFDEPRGSDLLARFLDARKALNDFETPPSPCVEIDLDEAGVRVRELASAELAERWVVRRCQLKLELLDAAKALKSRILERGPVLTEEGYWNLRDDGRLHFRRTTHPYPTWEGQCCN